MSRSSCPEVFCKKLVLKIFAEFPGKHLSQAPFFNKVAGLKVAVLKLQAYIKKETLLQLISCEFCTIFKKAFFTEHLGTTASEYLHLHALF